MHTARLLAVRGGVIRGEGVVPSSSILWEVGGWGRGAALCHPGGAAKDSIPCYGWHNLVDRQTDVKTLPCPKLRLRAVMINFEHQRQHLISWVTTHFWSPLTRCIKKSKLCNQSDTAKLILVFSVNRPLQSSISLYLRTVKWTQVRCTYFIIMFIYLKLPSDFQSYKTGSSAESSEEKSPATPSSATSTEGSTAPPPPPPAPPTVVVTPATGSDSTVVSPGGQNTTSQVCEVTVSH